MSPLVLFETLSVFVNTLTDDSKYPVRGCRNLQLPIQMQLPEKRKTFSQFSVLYLASISNFEHFETKDDRQSECISEITGCETYSKSTISEQAFAVNM